MPVLDLSIFTGHTVQQPSAFHRNFPIFIEYSLHKNEQDFLDVRHLYVQESSDSEEEEHSPEDSAIINLDPWISLR